METKVLLASGRSGVLCADSFRTAEGWRGRVTFTPHRGESEITDCTATDGTMQRALMRAKACAQLLYPERGHLLRN